MAEFSIDNDVHGDIPFAAVVIKSPVLEDELLSHCRSLLGPHTPKKLSIVPSLPWNAAEKVLKNELIIRVVSKIASIAYAKI